MIGKYLSQNEASPQLEPKIVQVHGDKPMLAMAKKGEHSSHKTIAAITWLRMRKRARS